MDDPDFSDNPQAHRFELRMNGEVAALSEYNLLKDAVMLTHTEVLPHFEGQGLGSKLAKSVLAEVRQRGLHVIPMCTFMAGYIRKHPEYLDLVTPEQRLACKL